jgi:hypothetical protein
MIIIMMNIWDTDMRYTEMHGKEVGRKHRVEQQQDKAVNNLTEIMLPERKTFLNELLNSFC